MRLGQRGRAAGCRGNFMFVCIRKAYLATGSLVSFDPLPAFYQQAFYHVFWGAIVELHTTLHMNLHLHRLFVNLETTICFMTSDWYVRALVQVGGFASQATKTPEPFPHVSTARRTAVEAPGPLHIRRALYPSKPCWSRMQPARRRSVRPDCLDKAVSHELVPATQPYERPGTEATLSFPPSRIVLGH